MSHWYSRGEILLYEPEEKDERRKSDEEYFRTSLAGEWINGEGELVVGKLVDGTLDMEMLVMSNRETRKAPAFCVKPKKRVGV